MNSLPISLTRRKREREKMWEKEKERTGSNIMHMQGGRITIASYLHKRKWINISWTIMTSNKYVISISIKNLGEEPLHSLDLASHPCNACFWVRMATAQSGFHHGTGGWHAVPEDCGILALAALVKCCAIELTSSKDSSERWMDAQNSAQSALVRIQCGACSRTGLGAEIWMLTGK